MGRAKKKTAKTVVTVITVILLVMLISAATYVFAFYGQVKETQRVLLDEVSFEETYDVSAVFPDYIVNIGLLGFDRGWNREEYGEYLFRPDMLAVLSINFESDQISVVRIPRDSYVPIHGMKGLHDKINHSFYYGYFYGSGEDKEVDGINFTLKTVSNVLGGIPIHYYVSVDMYSIIELVDAMGGVYYDVEETIYDKHWDVGAVLVPEGPQLMDGKTYLRYLQYRDDKTHQDYGRIDRQMNLLKETFIYLREQGKVTDIPATFRIYKDHVDTDLSYKQIAALAYYARDLNISDDNLHFYTVQGDGQMKDGIWYQVLFQNNRLRVIKEVFGIDADPWPPIVLVDSPEYLEEQARKKLEEEAESEEEEDKGIFIDMGGDEEDEDEEGEDEEDAGPGSKLDGEVVPEVRGLTADQARTVLENRGFVVGVVKGRYYDYLASGLVIQSEPLPGSIAIRGTVVNLIVSEGPEPEDDD